MLSAWSRHLVKDPTAKQKFEEMVKGSKLLTDRLQNILDELEQTIERAELSTDSFENPSWAFKQAYLNGSRAMLHKIKFITETETNV